MSSDHAKPSVAEAAMKELEILLNEDPCVQNASYRLDETHNVYAFINDNGGGDAWIEIHYELYESGEFIGDLLVLNTDEVSRKDLLKAVTIIIDAHLKEE